jgi:oligopeptide transport system ATP-binding protein
VTEPQSAEPDTTPLLDVKDLSVAFRTRDGVARAVTDVSFTLHKRETMAILGESGSGKSVTAQAIMGILESPPAQTPTGEVRYRGTDLLILPEDERRTYRGEKIAMIFQDALSSLNPVFTVGGQIAEMFRVHRGLSRKEATEKAIELMERVRIPAARDRVKSYPHEFSGGMRQRIMIAMALALDPSVVIADEPTTALDVTVQAQIMELLAELQQEFDMGLILITHDLGVVADVADHIMVMYAGRVVEKAAVTDLYSAPAHPYTQGLLASVPQLGSRAGTLASIRGLPPNLTRIPPGCAFARRCPMAKIVCYSDPPPPLREVAPGRQSACHFAEEVLSGRRLAFQR